MSTAETSYPKTVRAEHSNTAEAPENDLKIML